MKKLFRKELTIGICVLVALAVLFFGIDFLKGVNLFHSANYYYVSYTNVNGLAVSAPVTLNGYKVGQVRSIAYEYDNPGHVQVELALDKEVRLPRGSEAEISTDILGTATIILKMANSKDYYAVGDKIAASEAPGLMDGISQHLMPALTAIVPKVDTLLTTTNALLADPALAASVRRLDAITANLEATTVHLNRTAGSLQPIATDVKAITGSFVTTGNNLQGFSARLNQMPVDSLAMQLNTTVTNLRALSEELNNPNSTLGLLMRDPALYRNLNNTVQSLDSLLIDIKKQPKRYISIKLL